MIDRVKSWLAEGRDVRIFTARAHPITEPIFPSTDLNAMFLTSSVAKVIEAISAAVEIRAWCLEHIGQVLTITCVKDHGLIELYDDRAVQVEQNTGRLIGKSSRGIPA